jgi:tetratricopeptide (TPR) repeat protein/SAM-dependent methyltransferase
MKSSACLICHGTASDLLARYEADPYHRRLDHLRDVPVTYVVCRSCGFVYTDPMLDEQELAVLYGEKLRPTPPQHEYLKANRKVYLERYQWATQQLGLPNDRKPDPTLLEVGCAAGVALSIFRERGWRTCGIEPADTFASYARDAFGLDVQTGFYGPGSYEGRQFDVIMFSQVLEHVPDPDALLAQAWVNLPEDGHVYVAVPTLMRPLRPVHPMTLQAVHLWIFSVPTLKVLLERNGLVPVAHTCDAKGLIMLAKKGAPVTRHSSPVTSVEPVPSDSAERVRRYFREFTAEDSLYARNLAALNSVGKDMARPLDLDADLASTTVEQTPEGYLDLRETKDGATRRLYGSDPRVQAEKIAARFDFGDEGVVVMLGLGMGYLPLAVLGKLKRGHALVICEADPRVFHAAMFHQDLTGLFNDRRVFLVVGDDLARLDHILFQVSKVLFTADRMHTVRCSASLKWDGPLYARMAGRVKERLKVLEINRNTVGNLGRRMLRNQLENAHLTMRMPGVARFAGLFKGCPAIIVSAGPSLEKNFQLLREAKGRAIIIACDTVLRLLVPNGIVPDVTITADPHEATYRKFRDLPMDQDSILVCHPSNYPDIYRTFAGRRFTTETRSGLYRFLSRFWASKGRVDQRAQSSAHQAFNFATLIGADPIILVGQDLCYYDGKKHAANLTKGSPFEGAADPKLREQATDVTGRPVETTGLFLSFKYILEDQIGQYAGRVINATEGGLGLKGTDIMTLRDAIAEWCPPEPIGIPERFATVSDDDSGEADLAGLQAEVGRIYGAAKDTRKIASKMLTYVRRAERVIKRGGEESPRARYISELAERQSLMMAGRKELLDLLVEGAYMLELYMSKEETKAIDEIPDPSERFRKQIQRALRYYSELKHVLDDFVDGTAAFLRRLTELDRLRTAPMDTISDRLRAALVYKELQDFPTAVRLYRRILEEAPDNVEAQFHLGEIMFRCHRPHDALHLIKPIAIRSKKFQNVTDLIRQCREKAETWAAKQAEAKHSAAAGPAGPRLAEEGEFYLRVGDRSRAIRKFRESAQADPGSADAYLRLLRLHEEGGDLEQAVAVLEAALAANPGALWPIKESAFFAARHHYGAQAEELFRTATELDPRLSEPAGDALMSAQRFLAAGDFYHRALRSEPTNAELLFKAAVAYQRASAMQDPAPVA